MGALTPLLLFALATTTIGSIAAPVAALADAPPAAGNGTVTNASQILGKIPLKQLRLIVPSTPVYEASKAAVTLVFSRSVIRLGSNCECVPLESPLAPVHCHPPCLYTKVACMRARA